MDTSTVEQKGRTVISTQNVWIKIVGMIWCIFFLQIMALFCEVYQKVKVDEKVKTKK